MVSLYFLWGIAIGFVGGFLGSGGGCLAVAALQKQNLPPKKSHAASLALMLPISFISLCVYAFHHTFSLSLGVMSLIIPALLGAALGAWGLKKIPVPFLKLIFAGLILFSAIKILLR